MKRIILTGGGTAGHVTPNMALVPTLKRSADMIFNISALMMEWRKKLIEDMGNSISRNCNRKAAPLFRSAQLL